MNKHLDTSTFTHADSPKIRRHSLQHNFEYGYKSLSKHPITQKYLKHASKQNSRPVHSLMLSSQLFFCLPCPLPPFIVPCKMVLARPGEQEITPYYFSLRLFTMVRRSPCGPIACWMLAQTFFLVTWSSYDMHSILR